MQKYERDLAGKSESIEAPSHHHHIGFLSYRPMELGDQIEWWFAVSYFARLVAYVIILGMLVGLVTLILKVLEDCDFRRHSEEITERETSPLLPDKAILATYGTCEEDLESGNCSNGSREELYDGKVCIICFDKERNCFFIPCGHCATCSVCAQRIFDGENKTCPVCRRFVGKVRKLFTH